MRTLIAIATIFCLATSAFATTVSSNTYYEADCIGTSTINFNAFPDGECVETYSIIYGGNYTTYTKVTWGSTIEVLEQCYNSNCSSCFYNQSLPNSGNSDSVC